MRNRAGRLPNPPSAAGFVLAGGRSARMGTDKAGQLFCGNPMLEVALETFAEAGIPARVAGLRGAARGYADAIPDLVPDSGPMGGIHAALSASTAEWNVFLPVDLPLMPPSLLACLLRRAQATHCPVTLASLNGRVQPFPAVLHASALTGIAKRLADGDTACHRAWQTLPAELGGHLDAVAVEALAQCGQCHPGRKRIGLPPVLWFQSANTPEELTSLNAVAEELRSPQRLPRFLAGLPSRKNNDPKGSAEENKRVL